MSNWLKMASNMWFREQCPHALSCKGLPKSFDYQLKRPLLLSHLLHSVALVPGRKACVNWLPKSDGYFWSRESPALSTSATTLVLEWVLLITSDKLRSWRYAKFQGSLSRSICSCLCGNGNGLPRDLHRLSCLDPLLWSPSEMSFTFFPYYKVNTTS